jgi:hypothetical protein
MSILKVRYRLWIWLVIVGSLVACEPVGPLPTASPSQLIPSPSMASIADLPRHNLDSAYRPLALHGNEYLGLGPDGEIYLIDWRTAQKEQITHDGLQKWEAAISDTYIAWMTKTGEMTVRQDAGDERVFLLDIFVQNRQTGVQRRISAEPMPRAHLVLDGERLVWMDKRNELDRPYTDYDLYAYDLATDTEYPVAVAPGAQQDPSIHGDLVVWADNRNSPQRDTILAGCGNCPENRFDLYLYDFKTQIVRPIVEDEWLKASPTVFGQRVVWAEYADGPLADLYVLDVDTGLSRRLTQTAASEVSPVLSGDRLLWVSRQACDVSTIGPDGKPVVPDTGVYVLDLNTRVEQKLTDYVEPFAFLDRDNVLIVEGCQLGFQAYAVSLR